MALLFPIFSETLLFHGPFLGERFLDFLFHAGAIRALFLCLLLKCSYFPELRPPPLVTSVTAVLYCFPLAGHLPRLFYTRRFFFDAFTFLMFVG